MNKRKENYLKKLEEEYKIAIKKAHDKEGRKLQEYKKKIVKDGCFHPEREKVELDKKCDDGYGRLCKHDYVECNLCKKRWLMKVTQVC